MCKTASTAEPLVVLLMWGEVGFMGAHLGLHCKFFVVPRSGMLSNP